ncbi:MAG: Uma2 family endonuclease [Candidatus Rokubacteria bacterium]|nr:Uma2 family endonuclease [Candidatus Rokubacteria bacterium]
MTPHGRRDDAGIAQVPFTERRWSRKDYYRLGEAGAFVDENLELIDGQLIVAEPKGTYHVTALGKAVRALNAALPAGWHVRVQDPIALDDESEPEPDIAVVPGAVEDYVDAHPQRPALVVEVADTSLAFDRERKGSLYARGGIADYWIVNVADRSLEVYREPSRDRSAAFGWRYLSVDRLTPPADVAPLALPEVRVAVAQLLP